MKHLSDPFHFSFIFLLSATMLLGPAPFLRQRALDTHCMSTSMDKLRKRARGLELAAVWPTRHLGYWMSPRMSTPPETQGESQ